MAFIRQRNDKDCGVAAMAMLLDVPYEDVDKAIPWRKHGILHGTDTKMLRTAAERLGWVGHGTEKDQLKRIGGCSWSRKRSWHTIPDNSLVKTSGGGDMWHWVAWRKNKVYDPARGVFGSLQHGGVPVAYMQFTKETDDG